MMTEFNFFTDKADRWTKNFSTLWGNINICPCLNHLELPCHSPVDLISVSSFKVLGNIQSPHHDMAYLLVHLGNTYRREAVQMSLVWVNPHQTRTSTMEEVIEKLAACPPSGTDWPYVLAQLYEGSSHVPLPKCKHLGILLQGEVGTTLVGRSAN